MTPIFVLTNNKHLHLLRGFSYLYNKYGEESRQVTVVGFDRPGFDLPANFKFHSLGEQLSASKWSNGLIQLLNEIQSQYFILMLEDYWLYDYVDRMAEPKLLEMMQRDENILRFDLSGNRAAYRQSQIINARNGITIIESPPSTPYQMSFQAAIWNKDRMLEVLREDENPWQAEVDGSKRVIDLQCRVLGTNPAVYKYQPVWRSKQKKWQLNKIKTEDMEVIVKNGWLND